MKNIFAITVKPVDDGTVIERGGKSEIVTKGRYVIADDEIFMEHSDYEAFKKDPNLISC
jgi:hypothetical protein